MKALLWMNWKRGGDVVNPMGGKIKYVSATLITAQVYDARLDAPVWLNEGTVSE